MGQPEISRATQEPRPLYAITACVILALIVIAYANHFSNGFHFDDSHTIVDNLFIRNITNIPRFFTDARTFSSLPTGQAYRPLVSTSFAVDYCLGGGLNPFFFHLSTFIWFIIQGILMIFLYKKIGETCTGELFSGFVRVTALLTTGLYCLHPAGAETINYICARSDSLSTLAVVAAFVIYQYGSGVKRYVLCLVPIAIGTLCKPTAVMFAPLFFGYLLIIENRSWRNAAFRSLPILLACAAFFYMATQPAVSEHFFRSLFQPFHLTADTDQKATDSPGNGRVYGFLDFLTPPAASSVGSPRILYMATQPAVAAHYVRSLFLPFWLSADTDWEVVGSLDDIRVFLGLIFVAVLLRIALVAMDEPGNRPIAFGVFWFFVALIPTSVVPLTEVTNDHRMFFPYVGLVLAVVWAVHRFWENRNLPRIALVIIWAIILPLCAYGVHVRNAVWKNEGTLWEDTCAKSPKNGRAQMNLGLVYMAEGRFDRARELFQRALERLPSYSTLQINLGILEAACGNHGKAETFFRNALSLSPDQPAPFTFYAQFLIARGRYQEAVPLLERAVAISPAYTVAREMLLQCRAATGSATAFMNLAKETLALCPDDPRLQEQAGRTASAAAASLFLNQSLTCFREGRFESCIKAANEALRYDPELAEAWNNLCAANNSIGQYEQGLRAGERAVELRPDFTLARNNLAWSRQQIASQSHISPTGATESH
ncbi:MAG: tetratricopeptide repeat protein [Candidatus Riflebacteria bacterium]|nr:tetratricopeptide repeat protein [Candidatus Riflebacteria bacterium]